MMWRNEKGFAYLFVLLMMLVISATVVVVSAGLKTQAQYGEVSRNSSIALAKAESGLELGYASFKANGAAFNNFTLTDNSWNISVSYIPGTTTITNNGTITTTTGTITSTASLGTTYGKKVSMQVRLVAQQGTPNPLNQYGLSTEGTFTVTNGAFDLKGASAYGRHVHIDTSGTVTSSTGQASISTSDPKFTKSNGTDLENWQVTQANNNHVTLKTNTPAFTIPSVKWDAFDDDPSKVYKTYDVNSNKDISVDFMNAPSGSIIIINVTGGSPTISIDGSKITKSIADLNVTVVIKKDSSLSNPSSVVPTLSIGNGSYGSTKKPLHVNAYVDGNLSMNNGFATDGNFYVTGTSSVINGAYYFKGGFASKGDITGVNGYVFDNAVPNWNNQFFNLPPPVTTCTRGSWKEEQTCDQH